jgi:hypothetical protein
MKLTELAQSKKNQTQRALREQFEVNVNLNNLDQRNTRQMLSKVRGLLKETRTSSSFAKNQSNPSYLKMVMLEQVLYNHYQDIRLQSQIVTENEEVEKSQVILAAQDLVDQIQKMVEQVSKMNAEELPAVVTGISNEIGTSESETYQQSTAEALTTLLQSLTTAKGSLTSALGQITGESSPDAGFGGEEGMGGDMGNDMGNDMVNDMGDDFGNEPAPEPEEPENVSTAGRQMR